MVPLWRKKDQICGDNLTGKPARQRPQPAHRGPESPLWIWLASIIVDNYKTLLKIVATSNFYNHYLLLYVCNYLWRLFVLFPGLVSWERKYIVFIYFSPSWRETKYCSQVTWALAVNKFRERRKKVGSVYYSVRSFCNLYPVYLPASSFSLAIQYSRRLKLFNIQKTLGPSPTACPCSHGFLLVLPWHNPIIRQAHFIPHSPTPLCRVMCFLLDPVQKSWVTGTKLNLNHLLIHLRHPHSLWVFLGQGPCLFPLSVSITVSPSPLSVSSPGLAPKKN